MRHRVRRIRAQQRRGYRNANRSATFPLAISVGGDNLTHDFPGAHRSDRFFAGRDRCLRRRTHLFPIAPALSALPADQLAKAIKTDALTIPTPGELFAAFEKPGKPDWAGQYRTPIPMTYRNRAQIALNLGGLIADGFIAVQAQDSQQVKNIGTDIIKLAKALGVSENVLSRGNSINEFAENSEWDALQEELEATQNEVKASMQSHSDQDLVILVSLGGGFGARKS